MQQGKRLGVSASSLDYIHGLALRNDPIGSYNTAIGDGALYHNDHDHGIENTAIGYAALTNNTGTGNTAVGTEALVTDTTGSYCRSATKRDRRPGPPYQRSGFKNPESR
jgi:hypothetical protein